MKFKKYLPLLQFFFLALVFLFIGRFIYQNWNDIIQFDWQLNYFYLFLSFSICMISLWFSSLAWTKILTVSGASLSALSAYKINALSNIAHYVPGGVWNHAGKLILAKKKGLRTKPVLLSIILNIVFTVLSAILIFLLSLLFFNQYPIFQELILYIPYVLLAYLILFFLLLKPSIMQKFLDYILPKMGRHKIKIQYKKRQVVCSFFWFIFFWLLNGLSFYFLINSTYSLSINNLPAIIGIYAISWTIGFIMILAPSGAGVREASLILLLSTIVPKPVAIASALLFRLVIVARDITSFVIAKRKYEKKII